MPVVVGVYTSSPIIGCSISFLGVLSLFCVNGVAAELEYVLDSACFVYTCRRLIDLSLLYCIYMPALDRSLSDCTGTPSTITRTTSASSTTSRPSRQRLPSIRCNFLLFSFNFCREFVRFKFLLLPFCLLLLPALVGV